jgi:transcriptional regulator with XRE-family HTH domain
MLEWQAAIAAEIRARMAKKRLGDDDIAPRMGVTQTYFNRRKNGHTSFTAQELLKVCDIMDVDYTEVVAAAKASMTNLCLSHSEDMLAEGLSEWCLRGYQFAAERYGQRPRFDGSLLSA